MNITATHNTLARIPDRGVPWRPRECLLEAGACVAVTSRDPSRAEAVCRELGSAAVGLALDVRDEASVKPGVDETYERLDWHAQRFR